MNRLVARHAWLLGLSLAGLAVIAGWLVVAWWLSGQDLSRDPAQERREAVVELARAGRLRVPRMFNDDCISLPAEFATTDVRGCVNWAPSPLTVFFLTQTSLAPDPYCGYQYTERPGPIPDPLLSGNNTVLEDRGDGWYWICAS